MSSILHRCCMSIVLFTWKFPAVPLKIHRLNRTDADNMQAVYLLAGTCHQHDEPLEEYGNQIF